ncbi:hypothetical protein [Saccharothrix syringae]|uniref:PqqD family protein n=1 Tax=Saccharothrix syringae TaxID=103733 RepID=A0A5Q0H1K5_SACSY|nr:hypothetical protein [Saccharothrix syringae]QFZ19660.1 PqqD family protein [Saccharothrix syringae]
MPENATHPDDAALRFHALVFHDEADGEVTVGRVDTGSFVVLPADGAALLRRLVGGAPPAEAARWYAETYGEPVDVVDFAADLAELGFVRGEGEAAATPAPLRWTRLARVLFSPGAAVAFVALLACWAWAMAVDPDLVPGYRHLFFTDYLAVVVVTMYLGQLPLILLHEAAHALAGRRLGLPSTLSIGRRLHFVVFQTTLNGLVGVPRRKRFVPLLAGLFTDLAVMAALTLFASWARHQGPALATAAGVALGLVYLTLLRVVWQFWFFLQTDVYHLIVTVLGCVDLHTTARQVLANRVAAALGRPRPHDPASWHPRDRAVARWYSVLVVAGYAFMVTVLVTTLLPAAVHATGTVVLRLVDGGQGPGLLVDSLLFLLFSVGEVALAGFLYLRERRRARRA